MSNAERNSYDGERALVERRINGDGLLKFHPTQGEYHIEIC